MKVFVGNAHKALGNSICSWLEMEPGACDVGSFPDGETKVKLLEDVRGREVFVIQPTNTPTNHNLMELLIMVDTFRRASAKSIVAVIPYYGYARQDRKHEGRVPITAKLVANLLTEAGVTRVLTMDLHATQIQGFFDIPVDHLYALPLFIEYLRGKSLKQPVVLSPDVGGAKTSKVLASKLGADLAIVEKRRISDTDVKVGHVIGDVDGCEVVIYDDMITTAGSMVSAINIAREGGATRVIAMATHGLFVGPAVERLTAALNFEGDVPDEIVVTDSVAQNTTDLPIKVLSVADLLGEAISRIHRNKSVSFLFK